MEEIHISLGSIIGMGVSLLISVALPIAASIFWRKRSGAKWSSMLLGAGTFIVSALVLEQIFHIIVLSLTGTLITGNIILYALYGGICAGVFEETGRYLTMKFFMKKTLDKENSIMYGIGHGGVEAIIIVGLSMFSNIATALMINSGKLETILAPLDEAARAATLNQLSALWTTEPYMFFMGGIERIGAFFLHIALSFLVYKAVKDGKISFYILAVLIHFIVDAVVVAAASAMPIWAVEVLLFVSVGVLWFFVKKEYSTLK